MARHILPASVAAIGTAALVCNAAGSLIALRGMAFGSELFATMTYAQQAAYQLLPAWTQWALLLAVASGVLGSLGLILGRRWATAWFLLSALAAAAQLAAMLLNLQALRGIDATGLLFPLLLLGAGAYLWSYSHHARARGWLR